MINVRYLNAGGWDSIGFIPEMLSEANPKSAVKQLNAGYRHGGGWKPFKGFELRADNSIKYPGNPAHKPLAVMKLRDEQIFVYESGWVMVLQPDRSYEIARMD